MAYNKRVLSKAVSELGKAKAPAKPKDIITDPAGQWKYPGQKTRIPSSDITMQGVNYPVWAQPNIGPGTMMYPNQDYQFPGADYVDETPMAKKGGTLKSKKYSKSMSATNKLFAKNKLFQNKKSKIFDPNAEFKKGGSKLGPINLNPNPLSHYELNYGFNLPTKQDGGPQYTFPERDLYPEEDEYFRNNPHVGGMAAEDNHVIINPYSKLKDHEKDAIRQNEGARLAMRNGHPRPTFNLTDEQKEKFKDYSNDEQDQRETIIGRIISGDPSVGKVSPEQQAYADELSKLLKPAVSLKNTSGPRNNIISSFIPEDYDYEPLPEEKAKMMNTIVQNAGKGNIAARRMMDPNSKSYTFTGDEYDEQRNKPAGVPAGERGSHFSASMGDSFVPMIQEGDDGNLHYNGQANPGDKEAIKFNTPEEAEFFANHYKKANPPMVRNWKKLGGDITEAWEDELDDHTIELLRKAGYIVKELD